MYKMKMSLKQPLGNNRYEASSIHDLIQATLNTTIGKERPDRDLSRQTTKED